MKNCFLITTFLTLTFFAQSQEKGVKITDIYLSTGKESAINDDWNLNDFRKIVPQSTILAKDYSLFNTYKLIWVNYPQRFQGSSIQSLQLGLKFNKFKKGTLRLGLTNMANSNLYSIGGSYSESFPFDTITSSQTGQVQYVDSIRYKGYNASLSDKQLRLDASYIFRLNEDKRWSLYGGLGVSVGMSYATKMEVNYYENSNYTNYNNYIDYASFSQHESIRLKNTFYSSVYMPLGIDFQMGKKRDFWKPLHLFTEFRPNLTIQKTQNMKTSFGVGGSSSLGLRVSF